MTQPPPSDQAPASPPRPTPDAVRALALALLAILSAALLRPAEPTPRESFWIEKVERPAAYDLVLAGNSRVYRGLSPAEMRSAGLEARILNFGFSEGAFEARYLAALDDLLDPASARPALVLGVSPSALSPGAAKRNGFTSVKALRPLRRLELRYLEPFQSGFRPFGVVRRGGPESGYLQEFHPDGWVASRLVPERPKQALETYRLRYERSPEFRSSDELLANLAAWVRERTQAGVRIYAFRPPSTLAMEELEDRLGGYDEARVRAQLEAAGARWLEVPRDAYPSYDGSHLREDGARALSRDLAAELLRAGY